MDFIDRKDELGRLNRIARSRDARFVVLYGRRRIGKTRLLLEWAGGRDGLYTVADQSSPDIQRRYLADAVAQRLTGFADVEYRDWAGLLQRLAHDARAAGWRGPVILDELPYLVGSSPELPSVLQRWLDHEAKAARLLVVVAGSSQRMMQGLVLSGDAPLYGRAHEILHLGPLAARYLRRAFDLRDTIELVETYAAWGGVPRYWELAHDLEGSLSSRIEQLVLDPLGPLHREPDRLLVEETPSALEVRPLLDAIGAGANRVSELGARVGRPATSMARPLERLVSLGLVRRENPFGESEKRSRRSLYKIDDPFFRLWFRVVAPQRGQLASGNTRTRMQLLRKHWSSLASATWEELCRAVVPRLPRSHALGRSGPWGPASRWWRGDLPEWDIVAGATDAKRVLLGEAKWHDRPLSRAAVGRIARQIGTKPPPALPARFARHQFVRALFVPEKHKDVPRTVDGVLVLAGDDIARYA